MKTELTQTAAELAALKNAWGQLHPPSPMQSLEWCLAWWESYGAGQHELMVLVVTDNDQVVAIAPWYIEIVFGVRKLRWLGDGHACSDHTTLLCQTGCEEQAIAALADWLVENAGNEWHQLALEAVDDDDPQVAALLDALVENGCPATHRESPGCCHIDLPGDWESYLASVSKNHRKRCRRWQRDLFDAGRASVEVARTPEECDAAFEMLVELHNDRRMSIGEQGAFESPQFLAFHQSAIAALAAAGQVQIRLLRVDGEVAAAEYVLVTGETMFVYQGGLSAAGEAISAGSLSMLALLRDAVAEGYRQVDLLRGDEAYKFSWGAVRRAAQTHFVHQPTATGRLAAWRHSAWDVARTLKRRVVPS